MSAYMKSNDFLSNFIANFLREKIDEKRITIFFLGCSILKGVLAKNVRGYRHTAKSKRLWSLLIILPSVVSIRRKLLKTTHTERRKKKYYEISTCIYAGFSNSTGNYENVVFLILTGVNVFKSNSQIVKIKNIMKY